MQHARIYRAWLPSEIFPKYGNAVEWEKTIANRFQRANKVEFLERQFHGEKFSFVHKKESENSFELSLSTCVFYRRIFNLEMQNFCLKNHHMMYARQPFCLRMTSAKVSNSPASSPPPMWLPIWLLWGRGYGWFNLGENFFFQTSGVFSPRYNGVRFFFSIVYVMREIFFSAGYYFSQAYPCKLFSLEISVQDIFSWNQP